MTVQIYPISFGFAQTFLLKGEKIILIDAGMAGQMVRFRKGLAATHTQIEAIDLLLFTHGHFDHIGLAKEIADLSGAQVAVHAREKEGFESGGSPITPGTTPWGKLLATMAKRLPNTNLPTPKVDLTLTDEALSLEAYGIPGKIIYTPGHTLGSVSVLLDSGEAFVGDLAMSAKIMRWTPGLPIFAEDEYLVKTSLQTLLGLGAQTIYPAHGKPFSAEVFRQQLSG